MKEKKNSQSSWLISSHARGAIKGTHHFVSSALDLHIILNTEKEPISHLGPIVISFSPFCSFVQRFLGCSPQRPKFVQGLGCGLLALEGRFTNEAEVSLWLHAYG